MHHPCMLPPRSEQLPTVLGSQGQEQQPIMDILPERMADSQPGMFTNWVCDIFLEGWKNLSAATKCKCMKSKMYSGITVRLINAHVHVNVV